jgi:hypothetical protein
MNIRQAFRRAPPARRRSETVKAKFGAPGGEFTLFLTVSYFDNGDPIEVFCADAGKTGTDMAHVTADACVLISLALQAGYTIEDLQHSCSTIPVPLPDGSEGERPGSVVGVILEALAEGRNLLQSKPTGPAPAG